MTDASVVLGWLDPGRFAGGRLTLDPTLAAAAIEQRIAGPLGVSVATAALGIHRVVNAQMAEGIRLTSIHRGIDPRGFSLVALGGGGPLHACALAAELGIEEVIVPRHPGVLSALGLLAAPVEHEALVAWGGALAQAAPAELLARLHALDEDCRRAMVDEGVDPLRIEQRYLADVCFIGQSSYVTVPLLPDAADGMLARLYEDFLQAHERIYGHSARQPARIVNLRTVHRVANPLPELRPSRATTAAREAPAPRERRIRLPDVDGELRATLFERDALRRGSRFAGPAIVEQADTTTLVPPGWQGEVAASGELLLRHVRRTEYAG